MHWFVAAAVIALLAVVPVMKRLVPDGSLRDNLYNFHEALGALVLIVMGGSPAHLEPSWRHCHVRAFYLSNASGVRRLR
jgi:hypothetical protein